MRNEKKYVLTESQLLDLLCCQMECVMNERDGVDNWGWYGASRDEVVEEFYPDEIPAGEHPDFYETAKVMLESGAYPEQLDFENLFSDLNFNTDYESMI